MNRFATAKLVTFLLAALAAWTTASAQDNPPWNISMAPASQDSGFVTVQNKCTQQEEFQVYSEKPTVTWVQFIGVPNPQAPVEGPAKPPTTFTLASGDQTNYTIGVNTNGLEPGAYQTTVTVACPGCAPPACKYEGKKVSFPINLTVTAPSKPPSDGGGPKAGGGGASTPNGGSNPPNGGGASSTGQNNPPSSDGNPTGGPTTVSTSGTGSGTPTPTTVSTGTTGGDTPGTNPPIAGPTDPVPPTQTTNSGDWGALAGGFAASALVALGLGSGLYRTNSKPGAPPTVVRTDDNPTPPTLSKAGQDGTPGTMTKQKPGDWDFKVKENAPPDTTGRQTVTPTTTDPVPNGAPGTIAKSNGGDWNAARTGTVSDPVGAPVTPLTAEKPQANAPNTQEKSKPGDWDETGHAPLPGTSEKAQSAGGGGSYGVPPTQEMPKKQPGDWDVLVKTKEPQHSEGDRNEGGGRTFTRQGTPGGLGDANRPPTKEELAQSGQGISQGDDEYSTREKKMRQRMADRKLNKESAPPIVSGGHTFEKTPWDGKYDPTGESQWIKGVREDLKRDDVLSDTTRKKIREWQLEIYEDAYARARKAGFDNLTAHAMGQIAVNSWMTQSREQFEQMMGVHLAQIGQALAADPIGKVNQAIGELGQLGEQAAADMARTREMAGTADGASTEVIGSGRQNAGNAGDSLPENSPGTATERFTPLEADRARRLAQAQSRGLALMGEEDIAAQQASEAYTRMKALCNGDPSSLARAAEYNHYGRQVLADPQCRAYLQSEGLLGEMENMVNPR